ncbi:chitin-binding domain-containing protein, partial [Aeromonas sobria]
MVSANCGKYFLCANNNSVATFLASSSECTSGLIFIATSKSLKL